MLEVIAIITLGKSISKMTREKGLKPLKYVLLMIAMWIGFEIGGAMIGAILYGESPLVYLFALLGAAFGGFLSYQIAKSVRPVSTLTTEEVLDADL